MSPGFWQDLVDKIRSAISPPEKSESARPGDSQHGAPLEPDSADPHNAPLRPPSPNQPAGGPYRTPDTRPDYGGADDKDPDAPSSEFGTVADSDGDAGTALLPGGAGTEVITGSGMTEDVVGGAAILGAGMVAGAAVVAGGAIAAAAAAEAAGDGALIEAGLAEAAGAVMPGPQPSDQAGPGGTPQPDGAQDEAEPDRGSGDQAAYLGEADDPGFAAGNSPVYVGEADDPGFAASDQAAYLGEADDPGFAAGNSPVYVGEADDPGFANAPPP
jgi:hypothetical protein